VATSNPIARLDPQAVAEITVQPVVVNRAWVEIETEGSETYVVVHSPGRAFYPPGPCLIFGEDASALVAALAQAVESDSSPSQVTIGSYIVRVRTADDTSLNVVAYVAPAPGQSPFIVVGDRQYLLDWSTLDAVNEVIGRALCE
jgi:hypothetical protein